MEVIRFQWGREIGGPHEGISLQKEGMGMERLSIDMKRNLPLDNPSPTAKVQEEITWQL